MILTILEGVAGNCKSFPRLDRRKNEIELLEVDVADFPSSEPEDDDPTDATISMGTVSISDLKITAGPAVLAAPAGDGKCDPGTCFSYCICE